MGCKEAVRFDCWDRELRCEPCGDKVDVYVSVNKTIALLQINSSLKLRSNSRNHHATMGIMNLPLNLWFLITEYLSLGDLVSTYGVFVPVGDVSFVIKRGAVNVISTLLVRGTPMIIPRFT